VNKKKQKNFICFSAGLFQRRAKRSKSFLVLSFKKELLPSDTNRRSSWPSTRHCEERSDEAIQNRA
jgi:hypothetical protein